MLNGTAPTILFHGGEFSSIAETKIQDIFPVSFPFGTGGINEKRKNGVSQLECLKHYMRLSLPQMHRPEFILAVCSIYHRIKSFTSGFIMYQSMLQHWLNKLQTSLQMMLLQLAKEHTFNNHQIIAMQPSNIYKLYLLHVN
jgi:hypothetical protein